MPEEADIVTRVIPGGFGGLYQDLESQRLVVTLKDPTQADAVGLALRALLSCGGAYPGWIDEMLTSEAMGYRSAQFTATELLSYLRAIQPLRADSAIWAAEIDPELNRLWIGLTNAADLARVQQLVSGRAVPVGAVAFEVPPTSTELAPFSVLGEPIATAAGPPGILGVFALRFLVRYGNHFQAERFLERCPEVGSAHSNVVYFIEKWDGSTWQRIYSPVCELTALRPTRVDPTLAHIDSIDNVGVRRLRAMPIWRSARVTGTYRLIGRVYLAETSTPPFVANLAPESERRSAPFRILHTLPF